MTTRLRHTTDDLQHGAYFPPGTMVCFAQYSFLDVLSPCLSSPRRTGPIHARMVSVQPLETKKPPKPAPEPACIVQ